MARFFPSGKVSSRSRFLVRGILYICLVFLAPAACRTAWAGAAESGLAQPFGLDLLEKVKPDQGTLSGGEALYNPRHPYSILINYELGMHCVGFDISCCCIIPPYSSVQAQAIQTGGDGSRPHLLIPDDRVKLSYSIRDNSYSEGNKMKYWQSKSCERDGATSNVNCIG